MADSPIDSGWNVTSDETSEPVHVHAGNPHASPSAEPTRSPHTNHPPRPVGKPWAAVSGIAVALVIGGMFFAGVGFLRGSLTETSQTVVITSDGAFAPSTIILHPGDTLILKNMNENPQVLKSQGPELFAPQVIFAGETKSVIIAADRAAQEYVYLSETLPETVTLTITLEASATTQSTSADPSSDLIPIPPTTQLGQGAAPQTIESLAVSAQQAQSSSVSPVASSSPRIQTTFPGEVPTIQLNTASSSSSVSLADNANLPTNPYTVGNALPVPKNPRKAPARKEKLHGGAPLNQIKSTTATGPTWIIAGVLLMAVGILGFVLRRNTSQTT